jgi:hypothetical protein
MAQQEEGTAMRRRMMFVGVVVLGFVGTVMGTADADELLTTEITSGTGSSINCVVINVSNQTHTVTLELINPGTGLVITTSGPTSIKPLTGRVVGGGSNAGRICRITVDGPKNVVLGALRVVNSSGDTISVVPAQ